MDQAIDSILFRGGFIATQHKELLSRVSPEWLSVSLNEMNIKIHPDAEFYRIVGNDDIILIGSAFDAINEIFNEEGIIHHLYREAERGDRHLHEALNTVSGRYSLLIRVNDRWRAYHDAMGSRSLFYAKYKSVVASHVELISKILNVQYSDMFIPFITSSNWINRDVKYLPGSNTPYSEIQQLTPNLFFDFIKLKPIRYWPLNELFNHNDLSLASKVLEQHLLGLQSYISNRNLRVLIGLTGGTDSRGVYCATRASDPIIFNWVRSKFGDQKSSADTLAAIEIASKYNHKVDVFQLSSPRLNDADSDLSKAFRLSTGNYRGIDNSWIHHLKKYCISYKEGLFVRGFGGEVMRGFYQKTKNKVTEVNPRQLSNAYDVNAGSKYTIGAFDSFISESSFHAEAFLGRDANDMFYWEHRMGTWGSVAMLEVDLINKSLSAYNSRYLFDVFFGLNFHHRESRESFHDVFDKMAPEISVKKIRSV